MSGESTVVPVDVVQGIVQQLSSVSQHTTSAIAAMRHVVAEITDLRELRAMDTATMVGSWSGGCWSWEDYGPSGEEVAGKGPGVTEV